MPALGLRLLRQARTHLPFKPRRRFFSSAPPEAPTPIPTPTPTPTPTSSAEAIASKLPKRLRPYASRFINRPVSHITSFLVLHELTAIVPLGGLVWLFHATKWTPPGMPGEWVAAGTEKFGNYVRKKGWESFKGDKGGRLLFEVATAWAVVKALLPLRIGLSLWATPWFARVFVVPVLSVFRRTKKVPS
ncbi:uncharacterized protein H6S33_003984 [Morchella sextelata]|uniref:uncharacterized protein n=1 Tax=Morchella sextelata TaxID=1174677 RepID=UPI001D03B5FE|nr:uncharacterized protein H6S33_003984 [Morchella sextelata]KAH0606323.1 hypothetical protein H6S33_003984 [Morchella sextelata]